MVTEAPPFWWTPPDWRAYSLYPASLAYGAYASYRLRRAERQQIDLPVLCVGNLTVGGTGKTPVAIALAREAARLQLKPGFLSRGYGGSLQGSHIVDTAQDSARSVGDEPLLLAEYGPVAVTADRAAGAKLLASRGCDIVIMDDGFQSARIWMDYALIVVDAERGIGNGHLMPGGPLRAPVVDQMRYADAVVRLGSGPGADDVIRYASRAGKRVYDAHALTRDAEKFAGRRFLAFAGIGNPKKFFDTVEAAGATIVTKRPFADHHFYTLEELSDLRTLAEKDGLEIITTAKDAARLAHGSESEREFAAKMTVLEIDVAFDQETAPTLVIEETLNSWRNRRSRPKIEKLSDLYAQD